jgi:hypothetical protein
VAADGIQLALGIIDAPAVKSEGYDVVLSVDLRDLVRDCLRIGRWSDRRNAAKLRPRDSPLSLRPRASPLGERSRGKAQCRHQHQGARGDCEKSANAAGSDRAGPRAPVLLRGHSNWLISLRKGRPRRPRNPPSHRWRLSTHQSCPRRHARLAKPEQNSGGPHRTSPALP